MRILSLSRNGVGLSAVGSERMGQQHNVFNTKNQSFNDPKQSVLSTCFSSNSRNGVGLYARGSERMPGH